MCLHCVPPICPECALFFPLLQRHSTVSGQRELQRAFAFFHLYQITYRSSFSLRNNVMLHTKLYAIFCAYKKFECLSKVFLIKHAGLHVRLMWILKSHSPDWVFMPGLSNNATVDWLAIGFEVSSGPTGEADWADRLIIYLSSFIFKISKLPQTVTELYVYQIQVSTLVNVLYLVLTI